MSSPGAKNAVFAIAGWEAVPFLGENGPLFRPRQTTSWRKSCLCLRNNLPRVGVPSVGVRASCIDKAIPFYWCGITQYKLANPQYKPSFANHNRRKAVSLNDRNSEPATMSLVAHDIIEIESDDDDGDYDYDYHYNCREGERNAEVVDHRLMVYLSSRAADLAAAGITEGELELEFQRAEGRQDRHHQTSQDRRGRHIMDAGEGRRGRLPLPPSFSPPPQNLRVPSPGTPPRPIQKSRLPKLKPTPKSTPKPKRDPDDMMVDATCIICYSATTNTVLIPCGHLVLCAVCIRVLRFIGDIS